MLTLRHCASCRCSDAAGVNGLIAYRSWLLTEEPRQFEFGRLLEAAITDALQPTEVGEVRQTHAGIWECDLSDCSLTWSGGVYDLFGFPRGEHVSRRDALGRYTESSRCVLERLRSCSVKYGRGFTLDAEITTTQSTLRWVRVICAPVVNGEVATHLHGLKILI